MEDFRNYKASGKQNDNQPTGGNVFELVKSLSKKFDGKSQNELLAAIYKEAKAGKANGTLKNSDIDGFAATISPFLDDKKRGYLNKIVNELKKI